METKKNRKKKNHKRADVKQRSEAVHKDHSENKLLLLSHNNTITELWCTSSTYLESWVGLTRVKMNPTTARIQR